MQNRSALLLIVDVYFYYGTSRHVGCIVLEPSFSCFSYVTELTVQMLPYRGHVHKVSSWMFLILLMLVIFQ